MALTKCRECGAQISTAAACPQCGAKQKRTSTATWLAAIVCVAGLVTCVQGMNSGMEDSAKRQAQDAMAQAAKTPEKRQAEAAEKAKTEAEFQAVVAALSAIKASAKNPASFDVVSAGYTPGGAVCVIYRATNSFGAIVTEQVALAPSGKRGNWNNLCGGQRAADYSHARRAI